MRRMPLRTTKKVAKKAESDFVKREKEVTKRAKQRERGKNLRNYSNEKTKRLEVKQRYKTQRAIAGAKTKTVARSSATAATAISETRSQAEQARYNAETAKYDALITGNMYGENAVDKTKTGGNGNSNPKETESSEVDYYGGW